MGCSSEVLSDDLRRPSGACGGSLSHPARPLLGTLSGQTQSVSTQGAPLEQMHLLRPLGPELASIHRPTPREAVRHSSWVQTQPHRLGLGLSFAVLSCLISGK